ncbi:MAG: deoxyribonuclease V [Actinobacteria bacterium]|nr:MAG: deoxyribonuclease V [Actinomycetota bacterium]
MTQPGTYWIEPKEAVRVQRELAGKVVREDRFDTWPPCLTGGADVSYSKKTQLLAGVVTVLSFPRLERLEHACVVQPSRFPYVPGLLAFREVPAIEAAFSRLEAKPDVLLFDGHGYAHPRRFGLASYAGLLLDVPTIGVAKTILVGEVEGRLGEKRGSSAPLVDKGDVIGVALRTRDGVRPVYVSEGHRVSLETAIELVLACSPKYRLSEPIRWAHTLSCDAGKSPTPQPPSPSSR